MDHLWSADQRPGRGRETDRGSINTADVFLDPELTHWDYREDTGTEGQGQGETLQKGLSPTEIRRSKDHQKDDDQKVSSWTLDRSDHPTIHTIHHHDRRCDTSPLRSGPQKE